MTFFITLSLIGLLYQNVSSVSRMDPIIESKPSTPYPNFESIFDAFDDSAICPQIEEFNNTIVGTLECLHLNIYGPYTATSSNRLPVVVWIYGGGFQIGFAGRYLYGPQFLIRHGIVLVTINYRVGPYGFMCLDTPEVPGNQGLKDQLLALRWIKQNIAEFGGDPNKITIFGESAGSASVDFHLHLTQEDLFHQVILQSAVVLTPSMFNNPGREGVLKLAEHIGFVTDDINEALLFLSTTDPSLVIAARLELNLNFRTCVEQDFDNVEKFLADSPVNLPVPKVSHIPILIGFNNDEWLSKYAHSDAAYFERSNLFDEYIKDSFDFDDKYDEISGFIRRFYKGDEEESEDTRRPIIDVASGFDFLHPTRRSLLKYFKNGAETIFSYVFSYAGERNFVKYRNNITIGGAAHADEISYLFDVSFMQTIMSEEDQLVVDRITTMWANFVKYGDPTPATTDLLPVKWIPATKERWNYINIDSELSMETRPFNKRMVFLDLFYRMYEKYQIGFRI